MGEKDNRKGKEIKKTLAVRKQSNWGIRGVTRRSQGPQTYRKYVNTNHCTSAQKRTDGHREETKGGLRRKRNTTANCGEQEIVLRKIKVERRIDCNSQSEKGEEIERTRI